MLSRLYTKSIINHKQFVGLISVPSRLSSEVAVASEVKEQKKFVDTSYTSFDETKPIAFLNKDNVPLPSPFDGPERDLVNFPKPVQREYTFPVRHLIFPETWFKAVYPKIGVSGPYTLFIGLFTFLASKEILIIDDVEFKHMIAFFAWIYIIVKSPLGKKLADFNQKCRDDEVEHYAKEREQNLQDRIDAIEHEKKEQWRQEGKQLLFQAKREAVGLQLESAYRQNAVNLYEQVKRKLDYQVEVGKIENRVKQQFMVQWVIEKVQEAIASQSEKETIKKCIADLNVLATKV